MSYVISVPVEIFNQLYFISVTIILKTIIKLIKHVGFPCPLTQLPYFPHFQIEVIHLIIDHRL
jgi:hypothetical protein